MNTPRPNVRRIHPLDRWEKAMVEIPEEPMTEGSALHGLVHGLLIVLPFWLVVAWLIWTYWP